MKGGNNYTKAIYRKVRRDSELIRSTTVGILIACPRDDLAPLMAWMEECTREKARWQCSQPRLLL